MLRRRNAIEEEGTVRGGSGLGCVCSDCAVDEGNP